MEFNSGFKGLMADLIIFGPYSTPLYDFMAWGLTKQRDDFITSFNVGKYEFYVL